MTETLVPYTAHSGRIVDMNGQYIEDTELRILDVYAGGFSDEPVRTDAIATISAGYKSTAGAPVVSRDGKIHLHDPQNRAAGLRAALEASEHKSLTICFPWDSPSAFVHQYFATYSASAVLAMGDEYQMTIINANGSRTVYDAGTPQYLDAVSKAKANFSIYFMLAEWRQDGPTTVMPDGLGCYRLRTTSRNSIRALRAAIADMGKYTGGRIRGVPFTLALDYRDVASPDGKRHNVPVWTFVCNPPGGFEAKTFGPNIRLALRNGALLQIAPPRADTEEDAATDLRDGLADDEQIIEPTPAEIRTMRAGGRCDAADYNRKWHGLVNGSHLANDSARHAWLYSYTGGVDSLTVFLSTATVREAEDLLAAAAEAIMNAQPEPGVKIGDDPNQDAVEQALDRLDTPTQPGAAPTQPIATPEQLDLYTALLTKASSLNRTSPAIQIDLAEFDVAPPITVEALRVLYGKLQTKVTAAEKKLANRKAASLDAG